MSQCIFLSWAVLDVVWIPGIRPGAYTLRGIPISVSNPWFFRPPDYLNQNSFLLDLISVDSTFDFLNSRLFKPISVFLGGLKNRDSTVFSIPRLWNNRWWTRAQTQRRGEAASGNSKNTIKESSTCAFRWGNVCVLSLTKWSYSKMDAFDIS